MTINKITADETNFISDYARDLLRQGIPAEQVSGRMMDEFDPQRTSPRLVRVSALEYCMTTVEHILGITLPRDPEHLAARAELQELIKHEIDKAHAP